jgi:predicted acetyltransferase
MQLVAPSTEHLDSFVAALRRGWSPSSENDISAEVLAEIEADVDDFLAATDDRDPVGRTVTLPDGSTVPRLPGVVRWMWDGEFCGSINLRWQDGTPELPPRCLGHIGYSVVPWKRRLGYAAQALRDVLPLAVEVGLPYVVITTDPDNVASQRVIESNGGVLVRTFDKGPQYTSREGLWYRLDLDGVDPVGAADHADVRPH